MYRAKRLFVRWVVGGKRWKRKSWTCSKKKASLEIVVFKWDLAQPRPLFSHKLNVGFPQYFQMWSYAYKVMVGVYIVVYVKGNNCYMLTVL